MHAVAVAEILLALVALYGAVGVAIAVAFAARWVTRVVPAKGGVSLPARLLLMPAAVALWPFVLHRRFGAGAR